MVFTAESFKVKVPKEDYEEDWFMKKLVALLIAAVMLVTMALPFAVSAEEAAAIPGVEDGVLTVLYLIR